MTSGSSFRRKGRRRRRGKSSGRYKKAFRLNLPIAYRTPRSVWVHLSEEEEEGVEREVIRTL